MSSLAELLPRAGEALTPDDFLARFMGWVAASGRELYPAQEEALLELASGKHVLLNTPTGSGKSLVAEALHFKALAEGKTSYYTCPIKALVNEKFFALARAFGAERVGMMTGDASINRGAPIICCTAEVLANLCLREADPPVDVVVMDEFHYYGDRERGVAWQIPLLTLPRATFLLMSATLGDVSGIAEALQRDTSREVAIVRGTVRPVPLDAEYRETPLHETLADLLDKQRYPVYLVNFTQRAAAEQAQNLMSVQLSSKEDKEALRGQLEGVRWQSPYGKEVQKFLKHGIGLHHAGLLPKYRLTVEKLAQSGLLKVISGTDTLGMGVNIPIRTVLFTQLCKYDGEKTAVLSVRDFQQIAGRAGRKGFDDRGWVVAQAPEHMVENLRLAEKAAAGKKVVKRQPPTKGYAHWDRQTFERLLSKQPEALEPRFEVSHGMLLAMLQGMQGPGGARGGGYRRLIQLIAKVHTGDRGRRAHRRAAAQCFRTLRAAGLVRLTARKLALGADVVVDDDLQRDFSLHQTLSLYLIAAVRSLDAQSEGYALDVLTLVEAICEDPNVVLYAQLDKLKGEKVAALKAAGVEYEQRMEELDKLEWPKPNKDWIYDTFNEFSAKHPWVGKENIRPKSVARDMYERYATFDEYVREYGLERSEGVLLRYLSEALKTLIQTVPETLRNEALEDVITHLWNLLRRVDSSLLDEWMALRDPLALRAQPREAAALDAPRDVADDPRALAARLRGELHLLLGAVATRRWEDARASLWDPDGVWTEAALAAAMAPVFAEAEAVVITPAARRPSFTHLARVTDRRWRAYQKLVLKRRVAVDAAAAEVADADSEAGQHDEWALHCVVDLGPRGTPAPDRPLIQLERIGP